MKIDIDIRVTDKCKCGKSLKPFIAMCFLNNPDNITTEVTAKCEDVICGETTEFSRITKLSKRITDL